jgi:glycosyltransferase involved in cell wall biosynthesis
VGKDKAEAQEGEVMHIYIPTYRRTHRQRTWQFLSDYWRERTTFVCDKYDAALLLEIDGVYERNILIHPKSIKTIAQKRAWIIKNAKERYILMLDDDLRFCARTYKSDGTFTLPNAKPKAVAAALVNLWDKLSGGEYAHAGFGARQGNNNVADRGWRENARMIYALGYDLKVVRKVCRLGRIETREDMDYTLQLLRAGYKNCINVEMVVDQYFNAVGGAREERTMESSNKDAEKLAKLHPGLVKVVERAYKQSIPRKEVVVQWRKALNHG